METLPVPANPDVVAPPLPTYLQLEPVGQCNLRCKMCAIQYRRDGPPYGPLAFMPFERFQRIVEGFPALAHLHLQGLGEPTMHPGFFDMVHWASARGIRVSTNSNLTLLSERRARLMIESGLDELHASLDAATPALYEQIRVGAHFGKVLRNLRRVMAARAAAGSALRVRIVMVLMRSNLAEIPALVRLAADEGVGELFVQRLCHDFAERDLPPEYKPMRRFVDGEALAGKDDASVGAVYAEAAALAKSLGIELRLPRLGPRQQPPRGRRCDWPWTGAYVSYQGLAMPCCMVGTPDRANFGDAGRDGIAAVWHNAAYQAFRTALDQGQPPAVCRSCALYHGTF